MNKRIIGNFPKNMEISIMGKKMKLKLDEIRVESFTTSLNDDEKRDLKGGLLESSDGPSWDAGAACTYCPSRAYGAC